MIGYSEKTIDILYWLGIYQEKILAGTPTHISIFPSRHAPKPKLKTKTSKLVLVLVHAYFQEELLLIINLYVNEEICKTKSIVPFLCYDSILVALFYPSCSQSHPLKGKL